MYTCSFLIPAQHLDILLRLLDQRLSLWCEVLRDALLWLRWRRDFQRHEAIHQLLPVLDDDEDASKKTARHSHTRAWLSWSRGL